MAQRLERIAQFTSDRMPENGTKVQVLCEDHCGTYVLPFVCLWTPTGWANATTGCAVEAEVVGWRDPSFERPARPYWAHHLSTLKAPGRSRP